GVATAGWPKVFHIGIRVHIGARQADTQHIGDGGEFDSAFEISALVVAVACSDVAVSSLKLGLAGDDVDGAASGVAAIERALGTPDHLEAFEVEKLLSVGRAECLVDLIHINTNGG